MIDLLYFFAFKIINCSEYSIDNIVIYCSLRSYSNFILRTTFFNKIILALQCILSVLEKQISNILYFSFIFVDSDL